jgi:hypothetical protein
MFGRLCILYQCLVSFFDCVLDQGHLIRLILPFFAIIQVLRRLYHPNPVIPSADARQALSQNPTSGQAARHNRSDAQL